jgi:hypothetical protein
MDTSFFRRLAAFAIGLVFPLYVSAARSAEMQSESDIQIELDLTAQTSCVLPDGSATVVAIVEGGQNQSVADYNFEWLAADGTTPLPGNVTGPAYSGLAAGNYRVRATNLQSQAASDLLPFAILDQIADAPDVQAVITGVLSCLESAPFGRIDLEVDGGADPSGYQISWFEADGETTLGTVTATAEISADGTTTGGLPVGEYEVLVTLAGNNACATRLELSVDRQDPELEISISGTEAVHLDHCTEPNGSLRVTGISENGQAADPDDYLFFWFEGQGAFYDPAGADFEGNPWSGLEAGFYTALVVHKATLCTSAPLSAEVENRRVLPSAELLRTGNTSCTEVPNGILEAVPAGNPASYTAAWYSGADTLAENLVGSGLRVTGLAGGSYTLAITAIATNCSNVIQTVLEDEIEIPIISAAVTAHRYNCDPARPDGALSASVGGETQGYTFYWFAGEVQSPDTTLAAFTGAAPVGLKDGTYTGVARHDYSKCLSAPVVLQIEDRTTRPEITTQVRNNSSCDPLRPNGRLFATVSSQLDPEHEFEWYVYDLDQNTVLLGTEQEVEPVGPGAYRIVVRVRSTGCESMSDVEVADTPAIPAPVIAVVNHQTSCAEDQPNGRLSAGVDGLTEGYRFFWFEGQVVDADTALAVVTGAESGGLATGVYTLVAYDPVTYCLSQPVFEEILDQVELPAIEVARGQSEDELGTISYDFAATVEGLAEPEYAFVWYEGDTTDILKEIGAWSTIGSLAAGTYTVEATEVFTACRNTLTLSIFGPAPWPADSLRATALSHESIALTWRDNSEDEDGFHIDRKSAFSTGFIRVATVGAGITAFTDQGLMPETEYTYRVISYNANGELPEVETDSAVTRMRPPSAPKYLTADGLTPFSIQLNWFDNSLNELGFIVERLNTETQSFDSIAAVTGTTYTDEGLAPGLLYTYRVAAYNAGGKSGWSNEASFLPVITDLPEEPEFSWTVFPNPASGSLTVRPAHDDPYELRVLDAQGRLLQRLQVAGGACHLDVANISTSLMYLQIRCAQGLFTRKILKR